VLLALNATDDNIPEQTDDQCGFNGITMTFQAYRDTLFTLAVKCSVDKQLKVLHLIVIKLLLQSSC
jgi:hypothetical protein